MKRTVLVLAFVAALGMVPAHATKPFESQFTIGMQEGEWSDVFLPSGVLKEELISIRYQVDGDLGWRLGTQRVLDRQPERHTVRLWKRLLHRPNSWSRRNVVYRDG